MLSRRTQTKRAGSVRRVISLLARLPQPLALLEVGASAGLCLLPIATGTTTDGSPAGPCTAR